MQALDSRVLGDSQHGAYLPRKFKIAITGCLDDCILARINDLAFTPAERDGQAGFAAWVGGGLSDYPRLASKLDLFVKPEQVVDVAIAVIDIFKAFGDYQNKAVNRFRRVVEELGPERVQRELLDRVPSLSAPAGTELTRSPRYDHVGVHPQPQAGLAYVGLAVPVGRMLAGDLVEAARLAREYGDGNLRLTPRQNLVISGVSEQWLPRLLQEPLLDRFSPNPRPFVRSVVACTSAPFCKFGIFNVKQRGTELATLLDAGVEDGEFPPVRLHLSGCKASCAQIQVADVGLRATLTKDEERYAEAFDIAIGGNLAEARLGEWLALEVPRERVESGLVELTRSYRSGRLDGESFGGFLLRRGNPAIQSFFSEATP